MHSFGLYFGLFQSRVGQGKRGEERIGQERTEISHSHYAQLRIWIQRQILSWLEWMFYAGGTIPYDSFLIKTTHVMRGLNFWYCA